MKIKLPQYNGKDNLVMLLVVPLFSFFLNIINFGRQYFKGVQYFILATMITVVALGLYFILCGGVAVLLKKRFPTEGQLMKRLSISIFTFLIATGLFLYFLFHFFEWIKYFNYQFNETAFFWSYFTLGILNIFLTFLMEGISRYKEWQKNWQETEKLNQVYKQSQLHGLKSQVNPHFLFNSLNSLSSLIQDDGAAAEIFLDEMSKVYRYMLRNDEEQMVTVNTELKFIEAYMHLLNARYGEGLQLQINIHEADKIKLLSPLTLQVIIENAFSQNIISKANPLLISISSDGTGNLEIKNTLQPKAITNVMDFETGLDNLVKKYELLNLPLKVIDSGKEYRIIQFPLIIKKEEIVL
ncbi:hypothetical protein BH11BAC3_BH11BAC3_11810 [soil metagenome]